MPNTKKWSPELGDKLADHISEGGSIKSACEAHKISRVIFYRWIREYPDFGDQIDIATQNRATSHVDELFDIAVDENLDIHTRKLLSENIKWAAARMYRNAFGDKLEVDNKHTVENLSEEELREELGRLLKGNGIDLADLMDGTTH